MLTHFEFRRISGLECFRQHDRPEQGEAEQSRVDRLSRLANVAGEGKVARLSKQVNWLKS